MSEETTESSGDEKDQSDRKRLTPEQWRQIEEHWEYGTRTKEICAEFGVTPQAVTQHMRGLPHIKKASKQRPGMTPALPAAPPAPISDFESKRRERIEQTKEHIYRSSSANWALFSRIQKELLEGKRNLESCEKAFKVLRQGETFLQLNRGNRYAVLDIENDINEQNLPTLVLEDLTKEEIRVIQESSEDDFDAVDLPENPDASDIIEEGE